MTGAGGAGPAGGGFGCRGGGAFCGVVASGAFIENDKSYAEVGEFEEERVSRKARCNRSVSELLRRCYSFAVPNGKERSVYFVYNNKWPLDSESNASKLET